MWKAGVQKLLNSRIEEVRVSKVQRARQEREEESEQATKDDAQARGATPPPEATAETAAT